MRPLQPVTRMRESRGMEGLVSVIVEGAEGEEDVEALEGDILTCLVGDGRAC